MSRALVVVDDAAPIAGVVRHQLETIGFQCYVPTDQDDGWKFLISEFPDAAIVDIEASGANAWALVERIRGDGRFQQLPIVVLTGMGEPGAMEAAATSLGCEYLSKTMVASQLATKISQMAEHPLEAMVTPEKAAVPTTEMRPLRTIMLVHEFQIEGTVHLPTELPRFSDAWEATMRDYRTFVPVTDVIIRSPEADREVARTSFMNIKKTEVRAIYPKED